MLVVKVELHSAVTGAVKQIAQAIITNDGTGGQRLGNYDVKVARKGVFGLKNNWERPLRRGRVERYPRLTHNVWRLVSRALRAAFPEEVE